MVIGRRRGGFLIAAGLVSAALIAGCGGSSPGHSSQSHASARALRRAATATAGTGLSMTIQVRALAGGPRVVFTAAGSYVPRTQEGTMLMDMQDPSSGEAPMPMRVVIANGTIYERLPPGLAARIPGGRPWLSLKVSQLGALDQLPGLYLFIRESLRFADPAQYLAMVSTAATSSAEELGQASVSGVRTTHYRIAVDISKLSTAAPPADRPAAAELARVLKSRLRRTAMPIEVWVDRANLIRRLQTAWQGTVEGRAAAVTITANISPHGAASAPAVPPAAETTALLSLVPAFHPSAG